MNFCGTPLMPCRKPVSMDILSKGLCLFSVCLFTSHTSCKYNLVFVFVCRLDRQTQATTLVHQIFGGYLRSRGIDLFFFSHICLLLVFQCLSDLSLNGFMHVNI